MLTRFKDVKDWRAEVWYQVRTDVNETGAKVHPIGLFKNKQVADVFAIGKGWYGGNGAVFEVDVLTNDGRTGHIVKLGELLPLSDEDAETKSLREIALGKLSAPERKLLGLADL